MIKAMILTLFWMFIIPCIMGLGILKFDKKGNKNILLAIVLGFFAELLVFEILSIPMTFLKCSFNTLRNTWLIIVLIFTAISIFVNRKDYKEIFKQNIDEFKKLPKVLTITFFILVLIQCYFPFKYMHQDYDDSNFVAKATIAIDTNSLFVYDDAGYEYDGFPTRQILSQFPHFTASIATLCDVHPTILAHTLFPVVFVVMMYAFYYVFGMTLFKKDQTKAMMFLNILAIAFIFGSYSRYTNFVRIAYRAWQGKSILANITLPFIWYVFMEYIGKENSKFGWMILGISLLGSITLSSMALILPTITVFLLLFVYAIKDKKIVYIMSIGACVILCLVFLLIYLKFANPIVQDSAFNNEELSISEKMNSFFDGVDDENNLKLVDESYHRAGGPRYYVPIFMLSIVYIWVFCKEKNKDAVAVFSAFSVLICVICINPVFSNLWSMLIGSDVYWRVYWLLPIGYSISYMFTDLVYRSEKKWEQSITLSLCIAIFMITGINVYSTENFEKTDNYFKIPDWTLEMIFKVSEDEEEYKKLAAPEDFSVYTRQVDGNILLESGRWGYSAVLQEGYEKIYENAIAQKCNYVIIPKTSIKEDDPLTNYGFEVLHENVKYVLYKIDFEEKIEVKK